MARPEKTRPSGMCKRAAGNLAALEPEAGWRFIGRALSGAARVRILKGLKAW